MTVVSLQEAREQRTPHLGGPAVCIGCRHEWEAVAPCGVWQLECPSCGLMKGVFRHPIGAGEGDAFFRCDCGCEALTAYKKGGHNGLFHLRCMACGAEQTQAVFGE